MDHTELRRTGKFLLFSCSAGLIELGSFALFNEVFHWPHWALCFSAERPLRRLVFSAQEAQDRQLRAGSGRERT